jgi:hypothetical protein
MTDTRLDAEKRVYLYLRDKLREVDPDIDEQTLNDSLEGINNLPDMLAAMVRGVLDDEMMVDALAARIKTLGERMARFEARAANRRKLVCEAMLDVGLKRLVQPEFTASTRPSPPSLVILDENQIPAEYWKQTPQLLRAALRDDLKQGASVRGAELSNSGMTLSVRTK